jgi:periplasmic copper chaperone A
VRVAPKTGWDITIEKAKLETPIKGETSDITEYVSKITWAAQPGIKVGPDQFDEFDFTTGVLPKDVTQIAFKAIQTYDGPLADGATEARWIEERKEGQPDPKRPEPLVKLTPPTTSATAGAAGGTPVANAAAVTAADDAKSAASTAKNLGIFALILAIIAVLVAVAAIVAKPKSKPEPATAGTTPSEPADPPAATT